MISTPCSCWIIFGAFVCCDAVWKLSSFAQALVFLGWKSFLVKSLFLEMFVLLFWSLLGWLTELNFAWVLIKRVSVQSLSFTWTSKAFVFGSLCTILLLSLTFMSKLLSQGYCYFHFCFACLVFRTNLLNNLLNIYWLTCKRRVFASTSILQCSCCLKWTAGEHVLLNLLQIFCFQYSEMLLQIHTSVRGLGKCYCRQVDNKFSFLQVYGLQICLGSKATLAVVLCTAFGFIINAP